MSIPPFLGEFPDSIVADCVPCGGVMLANKITHNQYPASIAEREALQNAMGTQDQGADAQQLAAGMLKRYGLAVFAGNQAWSTIAAVLSDPTRGVVLFGPYQKLPPYIRNQGQQASFDGIHAIYTQGIGNGLCAVGDPLGTTMLTNIPIADLQAFSASFSGMSVVGKEQVATFVGYRAYVGPGRVPLFVYWPGTLIVRASKVVSYDRVGGSPVPITSTADGKHGAAGHWRYAAGADVGWYLWDGHSTPFRIVAVYSDGSLRAVNSAS